MKKNWKRLLALVLTLALTISLAACSGTSGGKNTANPSAPADNSASGSGGTSSGEKIIWKIGHNNGEEHYWEQNALRFKELVEAATNGQVEVQTYPNSLLGDDTAMGEMIRNGNLDMMITGSTVPGKWFDCMSILCMTGLFDSMDHVERALAGEAGDYLRAGCEANGMLLWDAWLRTPYNYMSTKPFESMADMSGVKIRTPPDEIWVADMSSLGFNPTPIAFSEAFTALQQGVVEAVINPISSMYNMRFQEVCGNLAITNLNFEFAPVLVSPSSWNKLTPELQQIFLDCEAQVREESNAKIREEDALYIEKLQTELPNMVITYPDTTDMKAAALAAHPDIVSMVEGGEELYDLIRASADH